MARIGGNCLKEVTRPGDTLAEKLGEMGLSVEAFSRKAGLPQERVISFIDGTSAVDADMAAAFGKVTGIPAHFWLKRQEAFDKYEEEREKAGSSLIRRIAAAF